MLTIEHLDQYYGGSHILRDVSLDVPGAACTVLLGRNGVGKTTLLKGIMGLVAPRGGRMLFDGHDITRLAPYQRVRLGIGYVPQGRDIFNRLTVEENLMMGLAPKRGAAGRKLPEHILELFPVLKQMLKRRGGDLSGGQQQQLAIGRALAADPRLLILDEPTEGIQPSIIKEIARTLNELRRERGFSILVSEQVLSFAHEVADRFLVVDRGRIVQDEHKENLDIERIRSYLTV